MQIIFDELTKEQKTSLLNELLVKKFGTARGSKVAAAKAMGCQYNYLINMLSGLVGVSALKIKKLNDLPDYKAPIPERLTVDGTGQPQGDYVIYLNEQTTAALNKVLTAMKQKPPITRKQLTVLFPIFMNAYMDAEANLPKFAHIKRPDPVSHVNTPPEGLRPLGEDQVIEGEAPDFSKYEPKQKAGLKRGDDSDALNAFD